MVDVKAGKTFYHIDIIILLVWIVRSMCMSLSMYTMFMLLVRSVALLAVCMDILPMSANWKYDIKHT